MVVALLSESIHPSVSDDMNGCCWERVRCSVVPSAGMGIKTVSCLDSALRNIAFAGANGQRSSHGIHPCFLLSSQVALMWHRPIQIVDNQGVSSEGGDWYSVNDWFEIYCLNTSSSSLTPTPSEAIEVVVLLAFAPALDVLGTTTHRIEVNSSPVLLALIIG